MVKTRGYRVELDGPGFTREQVLDHCPRRVPGYMVPDVVEFCEVLLRNSNGKVDRVRLMEHGR